MVLSAALITWWVPGEPMLSWSTLILAAVLAAIGEALEFGFGAAGARKAGSSRRGAALAIVGGVVGAIMGTPFAPIAGTLIGACLGAFAGSVVGDLWAGRPLVHSIETGQGAAVGRLWGTVAKVIVCGLLNGSNSRFVWPR